KYAEQKLGHGDGTVVALSAARTDYQKLGLINYNKATSDIYCVDGPKKEVEHSGSLPKNPLTLAYIKQFLNYEAVPSPKPCYPSAAGGGPMPLAPSAGGAPQNAQGYYALIRGIDSGSLMLDGPDGIESGNLYHQAADIGGF